MNVRDKSEAGMKEGVQNALCVLALVTGPVVNNDQPTDAPEINSYFKRDYCLQELRWAREFGIPIQPIIRAEDKRLIGELMDTAPDDLKDLGQTDFIHLDRSDVDYWNLGITKVIEAFHSKLSTQLTMDIDDESEDGEDSISVADQNAVDDQGPPVDEVDLYLPAGSSKWRWFFYSRDGLMSSDPNAAMLSFRTLYRQGDLLVLDVTDEEIVRGALDDYQCVSHRWEDKDHPDPSAVKKRKLIEFLHQNPHIKGVWIDYCCLPQGNRSTHEDSFFRTTLENVNLLYLCGKTLALIDQKYAGRFWTQYELFLALH